MMVATAHSVIGWHKGTMYPASVLDRILFATRYTRHLDRFGYVRFQNWKFYGEPSLAKAPVTVWVYEGSLKIEHQTVTLATYNVELQEDRKHLQEVSHPRLSRTPFRSPQLAIFDLGPGESLLYWKKDDQAPTHRRRHVERIIQLPLFAEEQQDMAVGADTGHGVTRPSAPIHLVEKLPSDQDAENISFE